MMTGHGDDTHLFGDKVKMNFSSNIALGGTPQKLLNHLQQQLLSVGAYPEPDMRLLRKRLASHYQQPSDVLLPTAGTTAAIYQLAHVLYSVLKKPSALIISPTFSEYQDACKVHQIPVQHIAWEPLQKQASISQSICFICNPNNPDGRLSSDEDLAALMLANPKTYFVIDEAYMAFAPHAYTMESALSKHENLIILKSLTKTFAMPGVRMGLLMAHAKIIKHLERFAFPWQLGTLPQAAIAYVHQHWQSLLPDFSKQRKWSLALQSAIDALPGFEVIASPMHYFLVRLKTPCAHLLKAFLVDHYGILIRDAQNFELLDARFIRIAAQTPHENYQLVQAFATWQF